MDLRRLTDESYVEQALRELPPDDAVKLAVDIYAVKAASAHAA